MSTEGTEAGQDDQPDVAARKDGSPTFPGTDTGVGLGAGEPNTFEPEEGIAAQSASAPNDAQVATAEETEDVEDTPVDTTEPS